MKDNFSKGTESQHRGFFKTKVGAVLVASGAAVGLGNIWRFPYMTGMNGGGTFLLVYFGCILLLAFPLMLCEFFIGRRTGSNVMGAFSKLSKNKFWRVIGILSILCALCIIGFYSVVAGWTLKYVWVSLTGKIAGMDVEELKTFFTLFDENPLQQYALAVIFLCVGFAVILAGVEKGIEKVSNILMPFLFFLLIGMGIYSLTLGGAHEGLTFFFSPDLSKINTSVILSALGQSFFSLTVGMGVLITYSSYFKEDTNMISTAGAICFLDTCVAILSGIVIFPAVFTFGLEPSEGPELVYIVLPGIFSKVTGGSFLTIAFFLLLCIAALTSLISSIEVVIAYLHDEKGMKRSNASLLVFVLSLILIGFCAYSQGKGTETLLQRMNFFKLFETLSSNIFLPIAGVLISLFVGWKVDKRSLKEELTNNGKISFYGFSVFLFLIKYVIPCIIILIFLQQIGVFNV